MTTTSTTTEVRVAVEGHAGRITLDRPQALNALTLPMIHAIDRALDAFEHDDAVVHVILDGAGDRAFCAGGDIVALRDAALSGEHAAAEAFWRDEYRLDARIARYPKPIVAVMDGIVMGGGVGLAGHASHRIATERLLFSMPEVGIGFAPDVGATWLLSRAPGEVGTHLALTGARIGVDDALAIGLADRLVEHERLGELGEALQVDDVDTALDALDRTPSASPALLEARSWIDDAYAGDRAEDIVDRLRSSPEPAAQDAAAAILAASPTSIHVALHALRTAASLPDLEACLALEYRVSTSFLDVSDFAEGIRAAVVDKDRQPRWSPGTLAEVESVVVDRAFAARSRDELELI